MTNKKILLLFVTINSLLHAKSIPISLGNACGVAGALRDFKLRNEAYPFDWIVSPFDALYKMFETDFATFLLKESLVIKDKSAVVDQLHNFRFVHDFPTHGHINTSEHEESPVGTIRYDFLNYFDLIKAKYERRIDRFRNRLHSHDKLIFIRNRDISIDQAFDLCALLEARFPSLDFMLVVVDDENKIISIPAKQHPRATFFYGPDYIDYGANPALINCKKIFTELTLL